MIISFILEVCIAVYVCTRKNSGMRTWYLWAQGQIYRISLNWDQPYSIYFDEAHIWPRIIFEYADKKD